MREMLNHVVFGWYPYLCLIVFLLGSLIRFDREQYSWRSGSSQLLRRRQLIWGSNLFHVGILVIFLGHFVGLLTPIAVFDALGISHGVKQWMAILLGGVAGLMCLVGMTLLVHRRLFDSRIRKTSSFGDIAILLLLYAQLLLGLATIPVSLGHLDGHEMVKFMSWAQGIVTLQPAASALVADVSPIFKLHLFLGMTLFLVFPFTRLVHVWSAPVWYLGRRGYQIVRTRDPLPRVRRVRGAGAPAAAARPSRGVIEMSCNLHSALPQPKRIAVNGIVIPRAAIAREVQHHPAAKPIEAWQAAARALVVRELLLQEARRLELAAEPQTDGDGRRETEDEALIRALCEREVRTPQPDVATCRRYYERHRAAFCSAPIYEAAHILFAARRDHPKEFAEARALADAVLAELAQAPHRFAELAELHSACPSGAQGGNLGQIGPGQTTPEFEQALAALTPDAISPAPVESRYGLHIIRLDRKIEGRALPFELVADRIAEYLRDSVNRRATAQYVARLVSRAEITGIALAGADAHRVN